MPLTKAQVSILTNSKVRQKLSAKQADFAYVDQLLRTVGEACPRLPAVWDRIFWGLDEATAVWLNQTFPGSGFVGTKNPQPLPVAAPPRTVVTKAIEILQSYKKSP